MVNIIYNKNVIAFRNYDGGDFGPVHIDPFEAFGTEYGMFIPITLSGYQFIRWVRKGMKDVLPKNAIGCYFIHVDNDGEVMVMHADSEDNSITITPVTTETFQLLNASRDITYAYLRLLRGCQTIAEACRFVEEHEVSGIYDPYILLASDWAEHAKAKGYDKTFYRTKFIHQRGGPKG